MAGRRTKLTPDVHTRIVSFIRAGAFDWIAAEAAGIHRATLYRWLERGAKRSRGPERDFYDDVTEARAQARLSAEVQGPREQSARLAPLRPGP